MTAWSNHNDAGPNVRHPMDLLIAAGCDTVGNLTRICSDASSTEMQCLRLLHHSGAHIYSLGECEADWLANLDLERLHG